VAEEADVVISWGPGSGPNPSADVKSAFQRPTKWIILPQPKSWAQSLADYGYPSPVRAIIAKYAPGVTPLRVAMMGFSAGCQGVAQTLSSADGARLDAVIANDGVHVGYLPNTKSVNPSGMKPWLDYAKLAVVNERLFVDTHSSVVPPNYASTTETANWLWKTLTGSDDVFANPPVPELTAPSTTIHVQGGPATGVTRDVVYASPPWQPPRRAGGLVIVGCNNLDGPGTADHIYQARVVLPLVLKAFLAERWNAIDPKAPAQSCFIGGPPSHPADLFTLGASCAHSAILPADFMTSTEAAPLPSAGATPAATGSSSSGSGFPWGTLALAGVAAVVVGGLVIGASKAASGLSLQSNSLAYTVTFTNGNKTALIKYGSADDPGRVFTLRVHRHGTWELVNPDGYRVSEGTVQYGQLGYARGTALEHTVDKAEKVFRQTGIWAYSAPNKERWGVAQP
jgi:hypothetical protein